MEKRLEHKGALVTGGSSGIGRSAALTFAKEGAKVIICDVNVTGGEEAVRMIQETGGEAVFIGGDVCNASHVSGMMIKIVDTFGRLDCALNNAGIAGKNLLTSDYSEEEWDHVIVTNLKGTWLCMKYEISEMLKSGGGSIVNISSAAGLKGFQYHSAYSASKHGVIGLTRTAALEYAKMNIRIKAICPGFVQVGLLEHTIARDPQLEEKFKRLVPMGRFATGEEISQAAVWLLSDAATFVIGHALIVDGGQSA
jgi:NAD(P)-dependent dehydrogenase (short-subunit alcohol dehydrogenase family)